MRAAVATAAASSSALLSNGRTHSRTAVIAGDVRRSKQYIARKELQKRAKQEYLRRIYETADSVEDDHLVFDLQPSSPRLRSQLQETEQHAALNKQLGQQIPQLSSWQQLQQFVQQHGDQLNFLNVVALVTHAAALQEAAHPEAGQVTETAAAAAAAAAAGSPDPALITQLTVLVLQQSSWFQPAHFAAAAVALSDLGVVDPAVWDNLTAAAQHKVGAFTFPQLAATLEALAAVGYTPELSWVERTYRQASKHLHAAQAADIAVLMGAWGEMGYTPRDRLFINQVKIITRRVFDQGQLSGAELVQLMHGLARMPKYAPNQGWLAAVATAAQVHLGSLSPGAVVDLLLSFVALELNPAEPWMDSALARIQQAMQAATQQQQLASTTQHSSSSTSGSGITSQQQQQQELLFLPPLDLEELEQERLLLSAGRLVDGDQQQQQMPVDAADLQDLQALFDEAEAEAEGLMDSQQQQQQQQQLGDAMGNVQGPQAATAALSDAQQQQPQQQVAGAMTPTGRLSSSSDALSLRQQLQQQQQQLVPEHLGILCWCLGRLQYQPSREWMQQLGHILLAWGPVLQPEVLVDVLLGCVATGYLPVGPLQQQLMEQVVQSIPQMPHEALRRTCQALVSLEEGLIEYQQHPEALASVSTQVPGSVMSQPAAAGAARRDASSILAPLQQQRAEVAAAVMRRQGLILMGSTTAQLADALAFIAAFGLTPSLDYMTAAVTRAVDKLPDGCPTPSLCTLLWALARLGFKPHPQLLHQLLAALQRGLHLLGSQDLADAGWALCTLRHRPGNAWLALYMKEVASKARYMSAQALTDTLWALACFAAQPDREWLKQVVQAVGSRAAEGALSQQNAAVVVWALQQLGFQPERVLPGQQAAAPQGAAAAPAGGLESAVASLLAVVQPA